MLLKMAHLRAPRYLSTVLTVQSYWKGRAIAAFAPYEVIKIDFGAVNELGVFAMTEQGLKEVSNPSAIFLNRSSEQTPGSLVMVIWEGTRPLLVEVQALVDYSQLTNPRRVTAHVLCVDTGRSSETAKAHRG
eukprot:TRINITY_DN3738_c0_g1_i1.p1 TRINITY_DN3738_c0_g1~~TRINITY_DN3738_c0_g1_i1.p1  ORF type:complete len:132 (+),score=32.86 TRINITY_DN3738_c0_g1_i1:219-614(+)